jgi:ABC-type phosphate transport system substrate-binding protein
MFKKISKGLVIGGALLSLVGTANAADRQLNIFGASAQYEYWTAGAPEFMKSGYVNCLATDIFHAKRTGLDGRDSGITICHKDTPITADTGPVPAGTGYAGDDLIIRYSTFDSAEGLLAAREENPNGSDAASCPNPAERLMANEAQTTFVNYATGNIANSTVTAHKCVNVTLGTSDIDPECFNQRTEGPWKWNQFGGGIGTSAQWEAAYNAFHNSNDDTDWFESIFAPGSPLPVTPWAGFSKANPFVVPFAFFRNNGATPVPVNNITKPMAQMLFSNQVPNWSLFAPGTDMPVTLCIRVAGSGTHATFDYSVVRTTGISLVENATHPDWTGGFLPTVLTNKGSSDEVKCVGNITGAIGYADADKTSSSTGDLACTDNSNGKICRITYQGYAPTATNVASCKYDFWGANVVYYKNTESTTEMQNLIAFMSNTSNMPTAKQAFWTAQSALNCDRADCKSGIRPKP